ncbi:MAG TPA: Fe-S cluster assembly protein SufD [Mycobacteriales bacterium]
MTEQTLAGAHTHGTGAEEHGHVRRLTSRDPDVFGVPTGREEDWRFTPLDRLRTLLEPVRPTGGIEVDVKAAGSVLVRHVQAQGSAEADPLVGGVLDPADRISALALAGVEEALVLSVPRDTVSKEPTFVTVRGQGGIGYGHIVVDVAERAEAVVVVDHVGSATLASNVECRIGDGASLTLVSLQDWDRDAVHVETQSTLVGRDARFRSIVVTLGGDLVRLSPTVRFGGPGGDAELLGLFFTDAGQHQEHRLFLDHGEPHCRSVVTYKGVLQGEDAHSVWIGDVLVQPAAIGVDTYELNRNLLLTDGARADSVPNLEIETGEVIEAGHASATGRFDDLQLFYLMSRGIPAHEARRLVVRGFFADIIGRIGIPEIEQRLTQAVEEELAQVEA